MKNKTVNTPDHPVFHCGKVMGLVQLFFDGVCSYAHHGHITFYLIGHQYYCFDLNSKSTSHTVHSLLL